MPRIKEVTLSRTFNLGNYENVKPEIKADLAPGENPQDVLAYLDSELHKYRDSLEL